MGFVYRKGGCLLDMMCDHARSRDVGDEDVVIANTMPRRVDDSFLTLASG